jgi:hypothetical protein
MTRSLERFVEGVLLATMVVAAGLLFQAVAWSAVAKENMNCANNQCIEINYWYDCKNKNGFQFQNNDCIQCAEGGRCIGPGGDPSTCKSDNNPQNSFRVANVTTDCDCTNAPNVPVPTVQSHGSASGDWTAGRTTYTCQ